MNNRRGLAGVVALGFLALGAQGRSVEVSGPIEDVRDATQFVQQMMEDSEANALLQEAKGVFVVPFYATGALLVGGTGGEGVLMARGEDGWSEPVFYNIGSAELGAQAGVGLGSIALVLRNDRALQRFLEDRVFGFSEFSDLSIVNWAFRPIDGLAKGDVVAWSDTEGLLGESALEFSGIDWDQRETAQYYGELAEPWRILSGQVENPHGNPLNPSQSFGRAAWGWRE